jgi:hypothetical protein
MIDSTTVGIRDWGSVGPLLAAVGKPTHAPQVEQLVAAYGLQMDQDGRSLYLESERHGLALLCEDGFVHTIFLYAGAKDDFERYRGALPDGLSFDATKSEIRSRFGTPEQSAKPRADTDWDRFECPPWYLHFTYRPNSDRIALLTVFPKDRTAPLDDALPSPMQAFDAALARIDAVIDLDRGQLPDVIPSVKAELRALETPDIAADIAYLLGYLTYLHPDRMTSPELQAETRGHLTRALPRGAALLYLGHNEYDLGDHAAAAVYFDAIALPKLLSPYVRLKVLEMRICCRIRLHGVASGIPAFGDFVTECEGHPVEDVWPEELARTLAELTLSDDERAALLVLAERLDRKGKFGDWFVGIVRGANVR